MSGSFFLMINLKNYRYAIVPFNLYLVYKFLFVGVFFSNIWENEPLKYFLN